MIEKISLIFKQFQEKILKNRLKASIKQNNLNSIKSILNDCVELGVNLNQGFGPGWSEKLGNKTSVLLWIFRNAKEEKEINVDILHAILDVRKNGHLVIDFNDRLQFGITHLSRIFQSNLPKESRKALLEKILGSGDVDIKKQPIQELLKTTISFSSSDDRLELLLNFCKGQRNFEINRLYSHGKTYKTLLDIAEEYLTYKIKDEAFIKKFKQNIKLIKENGGLPFSEIPAEKISHLYPDAIGETKPTEKIIEEFNNHWQNTHNKGIRVSIENSLRNLISTYSLHTSLDTLETTLLTLPENHPHKLKAIECFNRIKEATSRVKIPQPSNEGINLNIHTEITLSEVLSLVWQGILDEKAIPDKQVKSENDIKKYIDTRIDSLIEKLYEAENAYPDKPIGQQHACFDGTLNKIVESLQYAHPGVVIVPNGLAKGYASEGAIPFVRNLLIERPLQEQKEILTHWYASEKDGIAAKFREEAANKYGMYLKQVYDHLLSEKEQNDILSCFDEDNLPRPIIHEKLEQLIISINKIPEDKKTSLRQESILILKEKASNAYLSEKTQTFEETYQSLLEMYNNFNNLDNLLYKINGILVDEKGARHKESVLQLKNEVDTELLKEGVYTDKYQAVKNFYREFQKREVGHYRNEKRNEENDKSSFHKFWAGLFYHTRYTNGTKKLAVVDKVFENLCDGKEYDSGLDENEKEITIQTGRFGSALN